MTIRRSAELIATSLADDLALRALHDIVRFTTGEDVRIIGGHMAALLLTAFPVPGVAERRTGDADAAISTELAGRGTLHQLLLDHGYRAEAGNRYVRDLPELAGPGQDDPQLVVDLLVPSWDGRFRAAEHGGRQFDAAPGLELALAAEPIHIDVGATLLDGNVREFEARVPPVKIALIVKALAQASRHQDRDVEDIYRFLEIADAYPPAELGGWGLNAPYLAGWRKDAAAALHLLGAGLRRGTTADVPASRLTVLIAEHIGRAQP